MSYPQPTPASEPTGEAPIIAASGYCCSCKYWRLINSAIRNDREVFLGLCRYNPPRAPYGWALTYEDDLCRRHDGGE